MGNGAGTQAPVNKKGQQVSRQRAFLDWHQDTRPLFHYKKGSHRRGEDRGDRQRLPTSFHHREQTTKEEEEEQINDDKENEGNDDVEPETNNDDVKNEEEEEETYTEEEILQRAEKTPSSVNKSHEALMAYILEDVDKYPQKDNRTLWLILTWMKNQKVKQRSSSDGNLETPKGCIALLSQDTNNYADVFARLCSEAYVQSAVIDGIVKGSTYKVGEEDEEQLAGSWNAVQLDGVWHLINPLWVCRPSKGPNQTITDTQRDPDEYFFMTSPKEFIYWCHPDESKWQLLSSVVSRRRFFLLPFLRPEWFQYELSLLSRHSSVLNSQKGDLQIKLECPTKVASTLYFSYSMPTLERKNEDNSKNAKKNALKSEDTKNLKEIENFVVMSKFQNTWSFDVIFPVEGTYSFIIEAGVSQTSLYPIASFSLVCTARSSSLIPLPFNPDSVGFGPGPAAHEAGLLHPSHRYGIYSYYPNDKILMSFRIHPEKKDSAAFSVSLKGHIKDKDKKITKTEEKIECSFSNDKTSVTFEFILSKPGLYALIIDSTKDSTKTEGKKKKTSVNTKNVCNYLFTSHASTAKKKESRDQLEARRVLHVAVETDNPDRLDFAVSHCIRNHIPLNDDQVAAANTKAQILAAKRDIKQILDSGRLTEIKSMLKRLEDSSIKDILKEDIHQLRLRRRELDIDSF